MLDNNSQPKPTLPILVSFEWPVYLLLFAVQYKFLYDAFLDPKVNGSVISLIVAFTVLISGAQALLQCISAVIMVSQYKHPLRKIYLYGAALELVLLALSVGMRLGSLYNFVFIYLPNILAWYYTIVCFMDSRKRRAQLANRS